MTKAGADVIVAHCGCTIGGSIGAETIMELDAAVKLYRTFMMLLRLNVVT